MVKPTFLGIGVQKCASSWIRNVLHDHPEVFVSQPREVDFFSYHYNRGYTWYERHFDGVGSAKAIGEVSPSYFCDPLAPAWVREYKRDVKLILTLRDPIARAFSNHLHEIRMGHFHGANLRFETGLESNPMYLFQSRYGTHVANWLRLFPKDRVLLLVQEEIQADPVVQVRRLYSFLGVDPDHQSRFVARRSHESVGARNPELFRAWRAIGDFGRRQGLSTLVDGSKRLWPIAAIMAANRRDLRVEIPKIQPDTEQALQCELAPELLRLAELVGRYEWPWPTWRAARAMAEERSDDGGQRAATAG
jgi:Sulfotransferase domain